jgi:hypothetical protein
MPASSRRLGKTPAMSGYNALSPPPYAETICAKKHRIALDWSSASPFDDCMGCGDERLGLLDHRAPNSVMAGGVSVIHAVQNSTMDRAIALRQETARMSPTTKANSTSLSLKPCGSSPPCHPPIAEFICRCLCASVAAAMSEPRSSVSTVRCWMDRGRRKSRVAGAIVPDFPFSPGAVSTRASARSR